MLRCRDIGHKSWDGLGCPVGWAVRRVGLSGGLGCPMGWAVQWVGLSGGLGCLAGWAVWRVGLSGRLGCPLGWAVRWVGQSDHLYQTHVHKLCALFFATYLAYLARVSWPPYGHVFFGQKIMASLWPCKELAFFN